MRPATLSLCTVTNGTPAAVTAFLRAWRPHVTELVVAVDERAHPGTANAAAALADRVEVVPAMPYVERYLGWLHAQCRADWALRMDDDELPSDELIAALPELLASRAHTHFRLPARWLAGGPDRYLVSEPWCSDVHPRLVRNVPGVLRVTGRVHREPEIVGASRIVAAPFLHITTLLDSLADRRRRGDAYASIGANDTLETGEPIGRFYVPEDDPAAVTAPLPAGDTQRVGDFLAAATATPPAVSSASAPPAPTVTLAEIESHLHEIPTPTGPHAARVALVNPVPPLVAGATRHVLVEVENTGAGTWPAGAGGWPQVRVGAHWTTAEGTPVAGAASRGFFTERVAPGTTTRLFLPLLAPAAAGAHVLHVDVLEEHVRWFEAADVQPVHVAPAPVAAPAPPPPTVPRAEVFADDLRLLHDVLAPTAFADRYWVWGGLLLGWAREGVLLGHDLDDADFGFLAGDPAFPAAAHALIEAGFAPHARFRNNDGDTTEWCFSRGGAKFEFWAFRPDGDRLVYHVYDDGGEFRGPPTQACGSVPAQPRTAFRFLDRTWRKAADHDHELTALYGDWRTPDPGWWYMTDHTLVERRPWYPTARAWDGTFDR